MEPLLSGDAAAVVSQGLAILMGLALASTCGLRAFLPLFVISLLSYAGKVTLGESFQWMHSPLALLCFGTAVVLEFLGDKIPAVDHVLDAAGTVVKPAAATLATASMVTEFDPMLAVVLGLLTGGVAAEGVHLAKAKTRLLSTAFTGTLANPFLSVLEDLAALVGVILAVVVPIVVVGGAAIFVVLVWRWRRRRAPQPAGA